MGNFRDLIKHKKEAVTLAPSRTKTNSGLPKTLPDKDADKDQDSN